jgi:hypothetical protein
MEKAMRTFKSYVPKCARCHKPMTASIFDSALNAYVHGYDCLAPKGRPSPETRERLRKAAGV